MVCGGRGRAAAVALVALLLLLSLPGMAAAAPTAAPVLPPGVTSGFFTFSGDTALEGTRPIADYGTGFDVYVDRSAPHASRLADAVEYGVAQLQRYGIQVRYRGLATLGTNLAQYGRISVSEADTSASADCQRSTSADAGIITEAVTRPFTQDVGIATRFNSAHVTFCPPIWSHAQHYVTAVALHELGHAVGLGHYPGLYRGGVQLMNPIVPDLQSYQAGDVNGLRYLAAETAHVRAASALDGTVESWTVGSLGLAVTGWAIVGRTFQFANIAVTRDGESVYNITTGTPRPDITSKYDALWPNSGFAGSQVPMADGAHRYCVVASAPTAATPDKTLGCRNLAFPPPPRTAPPRLEGPPITYATGAVDRLWSAAATRAGVVVLTALLLLAGLSAAVRRRS